MNETTVKSQKIKLGKFFVLALLIVAIVMGILLSSASSKFKTYMEYQEVAVELCLATGKFDEHEDDYEKMVKEMYTTLEPGYLSYNWNGIKIDNSDAVEAAREADEALGKLMTDLGYETYSGSWYLEYTEFFDYFFNCYIDGVDDIKFAFDISGIIFVVVLLLFLVFLSYRKEMVVDDDVILCKRGKKTVKQFMLKDVKSVQNLFLKGIKVKGIGLRYGILLVKNRVEIQKVITDKMSEFATKSEQFIVPASNDTSFDDIRKYKELLDSGIITQEEFDLKKKQILGL